MATVVFGIYGSVLDGGKSDKRWTRWRPSVALCRHDDLLIDRFEMIHDPEHLEGARRVAEDIAVVSPETEVVLRALPMKDPWDFEEVFAALHDFSRGYSFDRERDDYFVHITTGTHVAQICWFLLTESRHFPARLLQSSPARRGSDGPGGYRVIDLDLSRYDQLATRFSAEREESLNFLKSGIDTRNEAFNRLIEGIERVALRSKEPILLTGPTGAGKSKLASQIYALKRGRGLVNGPLVSVNAATLRGDGAMSALFGHVKGAYTGAQRARPGLLRAADGGMLFLDEVGELGLDEQAMLLRAIETKRFLPVGTDVEVQSQFLLIAGTNRDLRDAVREGTFREDLLARINTWTFHLPGLAERHEDIAPNLEFELTRATERTGSRITMNAEARAHFLAFATSPGAIWAGNFRDFGNAVLRMATLAPDGRIDVPTVDDEIVRLQYAWSRSRRPHADSLGALRELLGEGLDAVDPFDRPQLAYVVSVCREQESLSAAGRALFSVSRQKKKSKNDADRLRKYLARFGLSWAAVRT